MPESTCLHIQERESGPIRVVEIPWISVRIGRASHCEVRLPAHDLAEEVCRLYRRGRSWHLVPATNRSPILLEGRPVDGPCPLAFDVPFRVGDYCLTLRHDRTADPDWGMYSGPVPRQLDRALPVLEASYSAKDQLDPRQLKGGSGPALEPASEPAFEPPIEPGARPLTTAKGLGTNPELARTADVRERWETRWRVAGAQLKARSERSGGIPQPTKYPYQAGFDAVPLKEPQRPVVSGQWSVVSEKIGGRSLPPQGGSDRGAPAPELRVPCGEVAEEESTDQAPTVTGKIEPAPEPSLSIEPAPSTTTGIEPTSETLPRTAQPPSPTCTIEPAPDNAVVEERDETERTKGSSTPTRLCRSAHLLDAGPTKRAASLGRPEAGGSLGYSPRSRRDGGPRTHDSSRSDPDAAVERVKWPSAKDILATHRATLQPRAAVATARMPAAQRNGPQAVPTRAREPGHWNMPVWLAGPPAAVLVLAAGLAGCVLSWWWACDSYSASIMTGRLLTTDRSAQRRPLPESVRPPDGAWTRSTAQHLAHWAIYLSRLEGEKDHSPEEISALLERALQVSPINATARLAMAQLEPPLSDRTVSIRSLGLSRDVLCLAWSARRLLAAGEKEAALKMYGQSLAVAVSGESSRAVLARFSEDSNVPRYLLPREDRVRDIVRELASRNEWTFPEWSAVLPDSAVVRLAAARLLREQGRSEAEALLDLVLDERGTRAAPGSVGPLTLAARAEAFALRLRWREAGEQYRRAIELIDDDTIKRSWWFNLADIALRLDDENQRQAALRAALAVTSSDDITRRATEIQRATRARPTPRSTGVKAN
ncbi:MAG: hypothetical protein ACHRXM_15605 [Isosphaerales bacterium]